MAGISEVGIERKTTTAFPTAYAPIPPLTTQYAFASSCQSHWIQKYSDSSTYTREFYSQPGFDYSYTRCLPNRYTVDYYSPGVCPSSWYVATLAEWKTLPEKDDLSNRMWRAYCCGDDFTLDAGYCTSIFSSSLISAYRAGVTKSISSYTGNNGQVTTTTINAKDYDATTNVTSLSSGTLFVKPFEIRWQISDFQRFEPSYASLLAARLGVQSTATATPDSNSNPLSGLPALPSGTLRTATATSSVESDSNDSGSSSGSLSSTGAKAGIGVGVFLGVVMILVAVLLILRRRKKKETYKAANSEEALEAVDAPELVEVRTTAGR